MTDLSKTRPTRTILDKAVLVRHLCELGVEGGDTVALAVDMGRIGRITKPGDRTFVESLLEAVGPRGTIVALTHSPCQYFFKRDQSYVYEPATAPCVAGRFSETVCKWDGAYRSQHPTCSLTAIGRLSRDLLASHDHKSTCFGPIEGLIQANAKLLTVGCTVSCPGFHTNHFTYEQLGLANQSLLSGWIGCYYKSNGRVSWFRQRDIPGCSLGFHKFYPLYRERSLLRVGLVGNAISHLIRAADSYRVEYEAVAKNPAFFLCDDPHCFSCRGTKLFNWRDFLPYYALRTPGRIWNRLTRKR